MPTFLFFEVLHISNFVSPQATLPNLVDIIVLMVCMILLFGIAGVHLFYDVYYTDDPNAVVMAEDLPYIVTINATDTEAVTLYPLMENFVDIGGPFYLAPPSVSFVSCSDRPFHGEPADFDDDRELA
jgi:hypothetical protein